MTCHQYLCYLLPSIITAIFSGGVALHILVDDGKRHMFYHQLTLQKRKN